MKKISNNVKYIFITGGVVSGIGKGILSASIGYLLSRSGYNVQALKLDPYLNVDPGTMSPYEHGEVYVLEDGAETDLDLGTYERFLNCNLDKNSSVSAGRIYSDIVTKERAGYYLGKTVQIVPTVSDYIQDIFRYVKDSKDSDKPIIKLIEIGGSTGDIEAQVFLESLRQFKALKENKDNVLLIHLGYLPYLQVTGEYKSKPLQNSVRELLSSGLFPDVLGVRYTIESSCELENAYWKKLSKSTSVPEGNLLAIPDISSIYNMPRHLLGNTNIVKILSEYIGAKVSPVLGDMFKNQKIITKINIALIAKYSGLRDSYLSVIESLKIAGYKNQCEVNIDIIDAEKINDFTKLTDYNGVIVPGGFGSRGMEEKISAIKELRESKTPFLGICLGMQLAVIEYLRNVCNLPNTYSAEMSDIPKNSNIAIDYMAEQKDIQGKGANMRLGSYTCQLKTGTLAREIYGTSEILERHRHRLEVVTNYIKTLEANGMIISGTHNHNSGQQLVEVVELNKQIHPFFIAIQSHPEFLSRPDNPHPLFNSFILEAIKNSKN